jgi:hypothetical protein
VTIVSLSESRAYAIGAVAAVSASIAATVPAVWWEPLHFDEAVTLEFARRPLGAIVADVFVERGGSPLHFFMAHGTLQYPGGIEGLRLPSVVFFLAALPVAGAVARRLCGELEAALLMPALALAPLAVTLATFARPYTLLLLVALLATWASIRAASEPTRARWLVAGGISAALVYVHPLGPLYSVLAFITGLVAARLPLRELIRTAAPGAALLAVAAVPYGYALAVLVSRFDIGSSAPDVLGKGRGRLVPEEAAHALTPGAVAGAIVVTLAALAGLAVLLRTSPRTGVALSLWLAVPIAFFTIAASGDVRFFGRHVFPVLPVFLLLAIVGCVRAVRLVSRRTIVGVALVAPLLAWQLAEVAERLRDLRELRLRSAVAAVERVGADAAVFTATGTPTASRPPELIDDYMALEVPTVEHVDELPAIDPRYQADVEQLGRAEVARFLTSDEPKVGVWVFAGRPGRIERTLRRLRHLPHVVAERASENLLVARSRRPSDARTLVATGYETRTAWLLEGRRDRLVRIIRAVDRAALSAGG